MRTLAKRLHQHLMSQPSETESASGDDASQQSSSNGGDNQSGSGDFLPRAHMPTPPLVGTRKTSFAPPITRAVTLYLVRISLEQCHFQPFVFDLIRQQWQLQRCQLMELGCLQESLTGQIQEATQSPSSRGEIADTLALTEWSLQ